MRLAIQSSLLPKANNTYQTPNTKQDQQWHSNFLRQEPSTQQGFFKKKLERGSVLFSLCSLCSVQSFVPSLFAVFSFFCSLTETHTNTAHTQTHTHTSHTQTQTQTHHTHTQLTHRHNSHTDTNTHTQTQTHTHTISSSLCPLYSLYSLYSLSLSVLFNPLFPLFPLFALFCSIICFLGSLCCEQPFVSSLLLFPVQFCVLSFLSLSLQDAKVVAA